MERNNRLLEQQIDNIIADILDSTDQYQRKYSKKNRKAKGQFFSSITTARYMASLSPVADNQEIRILDPGAGNGLLGVCVLADIVKTKKTGIIHLTFVENDSEILPFLYKVKNRLDSLDGELKIITTIEEKNFILDMPTSPVFDIVISNPPYYKISKQAPEAAAMSDYVYGQPNIYALFVVKAIQMLSDSGRFVFITPRSWTSGGYFSLMREYVLHQKLTHIHLFVTRDYAFSREEVLQETVIWAGNKDEHQGSLRISTSIDDQFNNVDEFSVILRDVIVGADRCLLLPVCVDDYELLKKLDVPCETFDSLGYAFKTGPVVEFRSKERISIERGINSVPMFRPLNIQNGRFVFPVRAGKAQYVITENEPSFSLRNSPTVIVKRMSSKEESRRLQCCAYYPLAFEPVISMENHVNYLTRKDGQPLSEEEVQWAYNIIASEQYDRYFRMMSGSTQVNARDLNTLPIKRRES